MATRYIWADIADPRAPEFNVASRNPPLEPSSTAGLLEQLPTGTLDHGLLALPTGLPGPARFDLPPGIRPSAHTDHVRRFLPPAQASVARRMALPPPPAQAPQEPFRSPQRPLPVQPARSIRPPPPIHAGARLPIAPPIAQRAAPAARRQLPVPALPHLAPPLGRGGQLERQLNPVGPRGVPIVAIGPRGVPVVALGAIFCTELDDALVALKAALTQAQVVGLDKGSPPATSYTMAKAYYDKQTSIFTKDIIAWGSACSDDVTEAKKLLSALNSDISLAGGKPVDGSSIPTPKSPFALGLPSWVVPTVLIGGGLLIAAPYLTAAMKLSSRRGGLAGTPRRMRRRR